MVLIGAIYGINPSAHSSMSWTTPFVLSMFGGGLALLVAFCFIEQHVKDPMFQLDLFRIRAFAAGNIAQFMSALARGGFMLMLTIWLQGIWLPLHGFDFERTPLWAGICMLPSSIGILMLGPLSGRLSDRYGARLFGNYSHDSNSNRFCTSADDTGRLQLPNLCRDNLSGRHVYRPLHVSQHCGHYEQPPARTSWSRFRHAGNYYEYW